MISQEKLATIPRLTIVRLDPESELNKKWPIQGLYFDELYAVLGEVSIVKHYILACFSLSNPRILPGMYHLNDDRFIEVDDSYL